MFSFIICFLNFRELPDYEKDFVTSSTLQLLDCNFTNLPADVILQRFMVERTAPSTEQYVNCFTTKERGSTIAGQVQEPQECKRKIQPYCPTYFDKNSSAVYDCYCHLHAAPLQSLVDTLGFKEHKKCIRKAETRIKMCLDLITYECQKRRVRSLKTIRMPMEIMDTLLQKDQDLKLLYLVRDPRGIIISRFKNYQISKMSKKSMSTEAKGLCERMLADESTYQNLQKRYPERITRVRYEDLAKHPLEEAQRIYHFTQRSPIPESVKLFLEKSMHANHDDGAFHTARANATDTAYKWRRTISQKLLEDLNALCRDVIQMLGYTL